MSTGFANGGLKYVGVAKAAKRASFWSMYATTHASRAPGSPASPGIRRAVIASTVRASSRVKNE